MKTRRIRKTISSKIHQWNSNNDCRPYQAHCLFLRLLRSPWNLEFFSSFLIRLCSSFCLLVYWILQKTSICRLQRHTKRQSDFQIRIAIKSKITLTCKRIQKQDYSNMEKLNSKHYYAICNMLMISNILHSKNAKVKGKFLNWYSLHIVVSHICAMGKIKSQMVDSAFDGRSRNVSETSNW